MIGSDDEVAERAIQHLRSCGFRTLEDRTEGGRVVRMTLGGRRVAEFNRDRNSLGGWNWNASFGDTGECNPWGVPQLFGINSWRGVLEGLGDREWFAGQAEYLLEHLEEMCERISDSPQVVDRLLTYERASAMRVVVEEVAEEERKIESMRWDWSRAGRPAFREFASCVADGSVPADREMALTAFTVLVVSAIDTGPGEWEAATARAIVERAVGPDGDMGGFLDTVEGSVGLGPLAPYREIIRES